MTLHTVGNNANILLALRFSSWQGLSLYFKNARLSKTAMVKIIGMHPKTFITQIEPNIGMSVWYQNVGLEEKYFLKY